MDGNPKQQLLDKLKTANNILVTVSNNPSVDQLAACIGLTLVLNKIGKHATAVFSGNVPSTIEFLKPDETIETNTDSLRDFIIALDKSKADKLRYKVEDRVVKIFITPYRTSISQNDLEFSQGDFNVDVVVALGVHEQKDLDQAITAHGRILHDATVATLNTTPDGGLGSINWHDSVASSLSEMVEELCIAMGDKLLDGQIATALLTGIVAETNRFSNNKTSAVTMNVSAELMAAGANQQLVANKLEAGQPVIDAPSVAEPETTTAPPGVTTQSDNSENTDGMLEIEHTEQPADQVSQPTSLPEPQSMPPEAPIPGIDQANPDNQENDIDQLLQQIKSPVTGGESPPPLPSRPLATEPPSLGGTLTANTMPEGLSATTDPFSLPASNRPLLSHDKVSPEPPVIVPPQPPPEAASAETQENAPGGLQPDLPSSEPDRILPDLPKPDDDQTLSDIEKAVNSPHLVEQQASLDEARNAVNDALAQPPEAQDQPAAAGPEPTAAVTPVPPIIPPAPVSAPADPNPPQVFIDSEGNFRQNENLVHPSGNEPAPVKSSPADQPMTMPLPPNMTTAFGQPPIVGQTPPPLVPPPIVPPPFTSPENPNQSR